MLDDNRVIARRAIAVDIDIAPVPRSRLAAALHRSGRRGQLVDDLHGWITSHHDAVVFFAAGSSSPPDEPLFRNARRYQVDLVAVINGDAEPADYRHWLRAGSISVVNTAASIQEVSLQVEGALLGAVVIPTKSAAAMTRRLAEPPTGIVIDQRQIEILEAFASGAKLPAIAKRLDRSERHTRRLIRLLVDELGAANTHAAVATATSWGWIASCHH